MSEDLSQSKNLPIQLRQYRIIKKIGGGTFGDIYKAEDEANDARHVALKLELKDTNHPKLQFEYKTYKCLYPGIGIPRVYSYFVDSKYNAMAMQLLGPSLEDLFKFCSRRFSLKTVLMLAIQMIERIEFVHLKGFLHRDIKPDNFVMDLAVFKQINQLFIIDFGLAKKYYDPATNEHIPFRSGHHMTGTARYASINSLLGVELSRRDDMEALGYVLMYFLRGSLPWQGMSGPREQRYEILAEKKQSTTPKDLCQGFPDEFATFLIYCRSLLFDMEPNYQLLRRSFTDLFKRLKYVNDGIYDWHTVKTLKRKLDTKQGEVNEDKQEKLSNLTIKK